MNAPGWLMCLSFSCNRRTMTVSEFVCRAKRGRLASHPSLFTGSTSPWLLSSCPRPCVLSHVFHPTPCCGNRHVCVSDAVSEWLPCLQTLSLDLQGMKLMMTCSISRGWKTSSSHSQVISPVQHRGGVRCCIPLITRARRYYLQ